MGSYAFAFNRYSWVEVDNIEERFIKIGTQNMEAGLQIVNAVEKYDQKVLLKKIKDKHYKEIKLDECQFPFADSLRTELLASKLDTLDIR